MNSKRFRLPALACGVLLLAACGEQIGPEEYSARPRSPCSAEGTPFADTPFADYDPTDGSATYQWHAIFERELRAVVDAHTQSLLGGEEEGAPRIDCTAATYREMFPASPALRALAAKLPEFRDRAGRLSEMDIGVVLQEWLRVYQCALDEETLYAQPHIARDLQKIGMDDLTYGQVALQATTHAAYAENEMRWAASLMERVTTLIGGFGRLRPLYAELTCLERATADIHNNLSLLAEAGVCMPRSVNARSTLRDFDLEE